ncbi:MAG: hypothetical protein PHQ54_05740 [Candidatus Omnitrophica bacterium]|nr:hypothetical protein [Candidatus Omnitrophota bacterium]
MKDNIKVLIYSAAVILLSISLFSALWLGAENKKMHYSYINDKAAWYKKNRDLEFELDKFRAELENIKLKMEEYKAQLTRAQKESSFGEQDLQGLADENSRLKDDVARLARENKDLQDKFSSVSRDDLNRSDAFWSNLLKEKTSLELKLSNLERLLERKDRDIAGLQEERLRLNQLTSQLIDEKSGLENRLSDTKGMVASLSESLNYKDQERINYLQEVERLEQDKKYLALQLEQAKAESKSAEQKISVLQKQSQSEEAAKADFTKRLGYINQILEDKMLEVVRLQQDLEAALQKIKQLSYESDGEAVKLATIEVGSSSKGAAVVAVDEEEGFIVIDRGRRDGLEKGMTGSIYKEGALIAKVEITEVREVTSAARIILSLPQNKIARNDIVYLSAD